MQHTSVPPWHTCYYPIPKHFFNPKFNRFIRSSINTIEIPKFKNQKSLITTNSRNQINNPDDPVNSRINDNLRDLCSVSKTQKPNLTEFEDRYEDRFEESVKNGSLDDLGMSWVGLKAALGQRINFEGIACSVGILARDKHLAIPNLGVNDIRFIDWVELKKRGFEGIVFDKDNTLTIPYNLRLWAPLGESFEQCRSLFGNNVAVFSNSAGLYEYDPDGSKAEALERSIGIKVIKHRVKKPAGTAEDIERHFGCESSKLIMVGDRPFTDIVYGNRNGFLTILTKPLSVEEEPFTVKQMRVLEVALVSHWFRKGLKATNHGLLPHPKQCIKELPW